MKKFNSKLKPLIKYRKEIEHLRQKELFLSQTLFKYASENLHHLQQEAVQLNEDIRNLIKMEEHPSKLSGYYLYLASLKNRIEEQRKEVIKSQQKMEERRRTLIQAMQKRKIVENLNEKQYASWDYATQEEERTFLDELATMRYMRDKIKK